MGSSSQANKDYDIHAFYVLFHLRSTLVSHIISLIHENMNVEVAICFIFIFPTKKSEFKEKTDHPINVGDPQKKGCSETR
jgi:hypothetical protein